MTASSKMPSRVEVLLGEAAIVHAIAGKPLQVVQCLHRALAAQPVQRPEQQDGFSRRHLLFFRV
jgi:hypothetical protein